MRIIALAVKRKYSIARIKLLYDFCKDRPLCKPRRSNMLAIVMRHPQLSQRMTQTSKSTSTHHFPPSSPTHFRDMDCL